MASSRAPTKQAYHFRCEADGAPHAIRGDTVNLDQPWRAVERELLAITGL
ncbi:hypothetical protein [Hymenobacter sp. YC55]|nr:hypothetical protein [Hymenobacter sp. YC55]MDF7815724.1 hypothetical protein [Hymenobacter sp. YC55]